MTLLLLAVMAIVAFKSIKIAGNLAIIAALGFVAVTQTDTGGAVWDRVTASDAYAQLRAMDLVDEAHNVRQSIEGLITSERDARDLKPGIVAAIKHF